MSTQNPQGIQNLESGAGGDYYGTKSFPWRRQNSRQLPTAQFRAAPYHRYVRDTIATGWTNLQDLDDYMTTAIPQRGVIVSVLDISEDFKLEQHPELRSERDLDEFLTTSKSGHTKVRLYMAEYDESPTPALIETFGSKLALDPRFFQWSINKKGHVFTPSQRHRGPYTNLGFGVLLPTEESTTEAERFKVLVYIKPDDLGDGWTGIFLFGSHTKHQLCSRILTAPPQFESPLPGIIDLGPKSIRELYIESFESMDLSESVVSPFYTISSLIRLNYFCWNQVIKAIRNEDCRVNGISDTSIEHTEEIKRSLSVVQRAGTLNWPGRDHPLTTESRNSLEEDFKHLVKETDLLWENRKKMALIRQKKSEARTTSLTNAFTYFFAPVTIMTGIYGMNVSEISGTSENPNIWQFFVAVLAMDALMIISLSCINWIHIKSKYQRAAGFKESVGSAF